MLLRFIKPNLIIMDLIIILSCIFSIIYLILFFRLCIDVSAMRGSSRDKEYNEGLINYYKFYLMGAEHHLLAFEALTGAIVAKVLSETKGNRKRMYEHLINEHSGKYSAINLMAPKNIF